MNFINKMQREAMGMGNNSKEDKTPMLQNVYVETNEVLETSVHGNGWYAYVKELQNVYVFTPEELEKLIREKEREAASKSYKSGFKDCKEFNNSVEDWFIDQHYPKI